MEQLTLEQAANNYMPFETSEEDNRYIRSHQASFKVGATWQIVNEQNKWISVKDHLPEKTGRYLIYFPERSTSVMDAIWNVHEKTCGRDFNVTDYVTHWMPLPEPPQS